VSVLDRVDLSQKLTDAEYRHALEAAQTKLAKLTWAAHQKKRSMVMVFEGWDAAGKGSAIRRVTQAMDPRLYRVVGIAAPTDEERAQHYLWRFWRHLPRAGFTTFFDRSWYGRVLVERVEGFRRRGGLEPGLP
jgi:polyphosphate kinase 2 (PPK2 family)